MGFSFSWFTNNPTIQSFLCFDFDSYFKMILFRNLVFWWENTAFVFYSLYENPGNCDLFYIFSKQDTPSYGTAESYQEYYYCYYTIRWWRIWGKFIDNKYYFLEVEIFREKESTFVWSPDSLIIPHSKLCQDLEIIINIFFYKS